MKKTTFLILGSLIALLTIFATSCKPDTDDTTDDGIGSLTDYDGNTYKTITIGNQIWMAENLRVTHYSSGTSISNIADDNIWDNLADDNYADAYCYYMDMQSNAATYGALYTWAAAMGGSAVSNSSNPSGVQGICPTGWHLPSLAEWEELETYLNTNGYENLEAKALKATSTWNNSANGTDNYGFNAIASGLRDYADGACKSEGDMAYWWTSTEANASTANYIYFNDGDIFNNIYNGKSNGLSVRCIKD